MTSTIESFKKYISEDDLTALNQILTSKKLSISDMKTFFSIVTSIKKSSSVGWYWDSIVKEFSDFCSNEQIINKSGFSQLLSDINREFQSVINFEKENNRSDFQSDSNSKKKSNRSDLDLLARKVVTIISVGTENADLKDDEYFDLLNRILVSNAYWENYDFIRVLFKNEILKKNTNKRDIALDVILNKKATFYTVGNGCSFMSDVMGIITNDDVLSMDDETFRKSVELAIENIQSYVLNIAMQKENLTPSKKKIVIDYYYDILEKYLQKYSMVTREKANEHAKSSLFSVVYCDRLALMEDEEFIKALEGIKKCNKPISYSKVVSSSDISEEQRNIAFEMIRQGEVRKHQYADDYPTHDYKASVAKAAISPVLATFPIDEYKKMLSLVDSYCQKAEDVYHREDNIYKWSLFSSYGQGVTTLLNNSTLFSHNIPRLLMAIDEITSAESEYLMTKIIDFCSNDNSAYYTDNEYQKVLELIKKAYAEEDEKQYVLVSLFTNQNVPFMEDKTPLFTIAISGDKEAIKEQTKELNSQGQYNMNLYRIFNGIDEDTIRQISSEPRMVVKKLVSPYMPK